MADGIDGQDLQAPPAAAAAFRTLCHDLRQPLVVAMGYVSMLEEGSFGELTDEVRGILATVAGRLDAINAIVDTSLAAPAESQAERS